MEIYVRYTSRGVSEDDLVRAFSTFGEVRSATIVKHDATGEPIGIGVVQMSTESKPISRSPVWGMSMSTAHLLSWTSSAAA